MNDEPTRTARVLTLCIGLGLLTGCHPSAHLIAPGEPIVHTGPVEVWVPREDAHGLPIDTSDVEVLVPRSPTQRASQ